MKKKSVLKEKSKKFGLRVIGLYKYLCNEKIYTMTASNLSKC